MKRPALKLFLSTLLIASCILTYAHGQHVQEDNIDIIDHLSLERSFFYPDKSVRNLNLIRKKPSVPEFGPIDEIWNKIPWNNSAVNFKPEGSLIDMGDVNGDGVDDFVKRYLSVADERDTDISSLTNKSLLYYGGATLSTDHDALFYTALYPIGDLNGDGFADAVGEGVNGESTVYQGSSSGLAAIASTQSDTLLSIRKEAFAFNIGEDLNGDSYNDIFGYLRYPEENVIKYFEIFGNSFINDFAYYEIDLPSNTLISPKNLYRFIKNDTLNLAFPTRNESTAQKEISIYKFLNPDSLVLRQTIIPDQPLDVFFISDFDGDANLDLIIKDFAHETTLYLGSSDTKTLFFGPFPIFSNSDFTIHLLGDLNGDKKSELLFHRPDLIQIVNLEGNNLSSIKSYTPNFFLFGSTFGSFDNFNYRLGFSLANSYKTFNLPISSDDNFGNIVFKTQSGSDEYQIELLVQNNDDFSRTIRPRIFHLSDLENDGIDNIGIREQIDGSERLIISNGLNYNPEIKISVNNPEKHYIGHVEAGYFNSKNQKSIVVLFRPRDRYKDQTELHFYSLDNLNTPYHIIKQKDLSLTLDRLDLFSNLGDINNDGYDDIAFSPVASNEQEKVFIWLGDENLSSQQPFVINLQSFSSQRASSQWGASVIQGIEDLNNDGIDDFILGEPSRVDYLNGEPLPFISGVVYVFFGQDTAQPNFSKSDLELFPDVTQSNNRQWIFGALNGISVGDFDGDGIKDIVAKSFHHSDIEFDEGVGALTYFFGKSGFTSQPDTTIPIKSEYSTNKSINLTESYLRYSGRAILSSIPDLNNDGADELLFISNFRNAVLYEIGDSPTEIATAIYTSPNYNYSIHPSGSFINVQYLPLVGDYNGDGKLNFIGLQPSDRNYRDTPIYLYEVDNLAVSNEDDEVFVPTGYRLKQNYPNPFNPTTTISFNIPIPSHVKINVFNMIGQKVSTLINKTVAEGEHSIQFNATSLASGIYLYRIEAGNFSSSKKMTLIK